MDEIFSAFYYKSKDQFLYCSQIIKGVVYYRDFQINLITGKRKNEGIHELWDFLSTIPLEREFEHPLVVHLCYEAGLEFVDLKELIPEHEPLAYVLWYEKGEFVGRDKFFSEQALSELELSEFPHQAEYEKKFKQAYEHLLAGNCYQINLTYRFYFKFLEKIAPLDFLSRIWVEGHKDISAFAHTSYIGPMEKLIVSNSPECLFMTNDKGLIKTAPIKGTKRVIDEAELEKLWKELSEDIKEQSELFMISDLLRNDLTKIALTPSKVERLKLPLKVPGLLHQYSLLSTTLPKGVDLYDIVSALFPGGSITGAPKKKVMSIISELEKDARRLYCGSSFLCYGKNKSASINIRTSEIDCGSGELVYGAGGGITLRSQMDAEFDEMLAKMKSFIHLLKKVP